MSPTFWRSVDALLPAALRDADPEARARARLLLAYLLLTAVAGFGIASLDAILGLTDIALRILIVPAALGLALLLRWSRRVAVIALVYIVGLAFVSAGMSALDPLPGAPYMVWVLVLGFTPAIGPNLALNFAVVAVAAGLCFVISVPPGAHCVLALPGDLFFLILVGWLAMVFVLDTHKMAVAEHGAAHAAQRERERAIDEASRALLREAKDTLTFMTTVSHELRTPLNGVLGLTSLLGDEEISDGARADLVDIRRAARSVLRIFDSLLYLTRVTADGAHEAQPTDLPALVDAVVTAASDEVACGASVTLAVDPGLPRVVFVDSATLRAMLRQILGSALDAGVEDLAVTVRKLGRELVIVVHGGSPVGVEGTPLDLGLSLAAELANSQDGDLTCEGDGGFLATMTFPCPSLAAAGDLPLHARGVRPR